MVVPFEFGRIGSEAVHFRTNTLDPSMFFATLAPYSQNPWLCALLRFFYDVHACLPLWTFVGCMLLLPLNLSARFLGSFAGSAPLLHWPLVGRLELSRRGRLLKALGWQKMRTEALRRCVDTVDPSTRWRLRPMVALHTG